MTPTDHLNRLLTRYPALQVCEGSLHACLQVLVTSYKAGKKSLICGNGGSTADAQHIVGELMKGFLLKRPVPEALAGSIGAELAAKLQMPLRAVSLTGESALIHAVNNDLGGDVVFAQQVLGLADAGDVLWCFSTSGNSPNILNAARVASALGAKVVGFTGATGGELKDLCDVCICAPCTDANTATPDAQELHLAIYHMLCCALEAEFFTE